MTAALSIHDLSARRAGAMVLTAISLTLGRGAVVGVIGPNGAGKTTLMRAIIGLERDVQGRVTLLGQDATGLAPEKRARLGVGYVPEGRRVFPGMTARDNLLVASVAARAERAGDLERVFALFPDLAAKADAAAWRLSGGQQQMLAIGRALMTRPQVLLMDEPTLGLSPMMVERVLAAVDVIARDGVAILVADQNVRRLPPAVSRVLTLVSGRVVFDGAPREADAVAHQAILGGGGGGGGAGGA